MSYMKAIVMAAICASMAATTSAAQHQGHTMPAADTAKKSAVKTAKKKTVRPAKKSAAPSPARKRTPVRNPRDLTQPPPPPPPNAQRFDTTDAAHEGMSHSVPAATAPGTTHPTGHNATSPKVTDSAHAAMGHTVKPPAKAPVHGKTAHAGHADSTARTTGMHEMSPGVLGISMDRMGSGTTWIPDAVTLPSRHFMRGKWELMLHGFAFGQYNTQSGPRGDDQLGSVNWAMLMASRDLAGGKFQIRFMPSLDRATVGRCGYPVLLQSGETCNGEALVDRQHPHEFFMELGALYERELTSNLALSLYAAPAGEPALGPVAFMHRPSAMDDPVAPLSHHWQDATHISFGVLTGGLFTRHVKIEGSLFNGREPDESRFNFDPIKLDSWSGRLTVNPSANWSFTGGYGFLKSPESLHPEESMRRATASVLHGVRVGADGQWASSFIAGANKHGAGNESGWSRAFLLESELITSRTNTFFGRVESVRKNGEELQIPGLGEDDGVNVSHISLGYIREIVRGRGMTFGIGGRGTVNFVPRILEEPYGSRNPTGAVVFLRVRPFHARKAGAMEGMKH